MSLTEIFRRGLATKNVMFTFVEGMTVHDWNETIASLLVVQFSTFRRL